MRANVLLSGIHIYNLRNEKKKEMREGERERERRTLALALVFYAFSSGSVVIARMLKQWQLLELLKLDFCVNLSDFYSVHAHVYTHHSDSCLRNFRLTCANEFPDRATSNCHWFFQLSLSLSCFFFLSQTFNENFTKSFRKNRVWLNCAHACFKPKKSSFDFNLNLITQKKRNMH